MIYIVSEDKIKTKNFKLNLINGITIKPKIPNFEYDKLVLYKDNFKEKYIIDSYLNNYKKILNMFLYDSDDSENCGIILNEISRLESVILKKYTKHLKTEKTKKLLKELLMLEQSVKKKILYYSNIEKKQSNKSR